MLGDNKAVPRLLSEVFATVQTGFYERTVCQLSQVMWRMVAVMARPMIGSAMGKPSPDHRGGGDDAQAYDGVGAGVQAVSDQGRAFQSASCADADSRRRRVADEADQARQREGEQVGGREWVDETIYGDPCGDAGGHEDGEDDRESCLALGMGGAEDERDP